MLTVRATITLDAVLLAEADQAARPMEVSRSRLMAESIGEYLQRKRGTEILAEFNAAYTDDLDADEIRFLAAGSEALCAQTEREGER